MSRSDVLMRLQNDRSRGFVWSSPLHTFSLSSFLNCPNPPSTSTSTSTSLVSDRNYESKGLHKIAACWWCSVILLYLICPFHITLAFSSGSKELGNAERCACNPRILS
ncbi:hypothetical protein MLD38_030005 [Melastoma candidum]|uniref:Uncharacterized protein n=1 Tax=Melastoma candidum TaxID=119954 RepID=A0ACB9MK16_9MYRT|nr:hypothetical protein MLD38_030005 [Melastoma candidum]